MNAEILFDLLYRAASPELSAWMTRKRLPVLAVLERWLAELQAQDAKSFVEPDIRIIYDPAEGLYLESPKSAAETIKSLRDTRQIPYFRWHPSVKRWGVNGSRDKPWDYPIENLERYAQHFRDAGFTAEAKVIGERRAFAEQVADIEARAIDRAERLESAAERASRESQARYAAVRQIGDMIPMGQPILVDHYSASRHRGDISRMDANMRKSVEAERTAQELSERAALAERRASYGTDPRKAATRLATLKKAVKTIQDHIDAHPGQEMPRNREKLAALLEEQAHWLAIAPEVEAKQDAFNGMKTATKVLKKALGASRLMQGASGAGAKKWAIYSIYGPVVGKGRYGDDHAWSGQLYVTPTSVEFTPHALTASLSKYRVESAGRTAEETMLDLAQRMSAEVAAANKGV